MGLRVLHLGKFYPPFAGGIENFMAVLLPALQQHEIQTHALVHTHESPGWQLRLGAETDPQYPSVYRAPCYGRLLYAPISPQFPLWLNQVLRQTKPDILHLHMPNTSVFFALLDPLARRIPWVVHWHSDVVASDLDTRLRWAYRAYRPFEQAVLKRSQAIIATSPPYRDYSPALGDWQDKISVIPLGLPLESEHKIPTHARYWAQQAWGEPQPKLRVLNIGRLTYYKGQSLLLKAAQQLDNIKILCVGRGEHEATLREQIARNHLAHKVELLGYRSDDELNALLASCDCFCLPSLERTEAFGVVLLEAMQHKKALVGSDIRGSGVPWVIGENGLITPVGSSQGLSNALRQLRDNPDLCQRLGARGYERLQQQFDIQQVAAQTARLYQRVQLQYGGD